MRCGCWRAVVVDTGGADTAKHVAEFIRKGMTIEHTTVGEARKNLQRCPHPPVFGAVQ